jgi:hypothetical protein
MSDPQGPFGVTQHGAPEPVFGQNAGLQLPEPPTPPAPPTPPVPPNPLAPPAPPKLLPESVTAPPVPAQPESTPLPPVPPEKLPPVPLDASSGPEPALPSSKSPSSSLVAQESAAERAAAQKIKLRFIVSRSHWQTPRHVAIAGIAVEPACGQRISGRDPNAVRTLDALGAARGHLRRREISANGIGTGVALPDAWPTRNVASVPELPLGCA